jgi:hypothetical protein
VLTTVPVDSGRSARSLSSAAIVRRIVAHRSSTFGGVGWSKDLLAIVIATAAVVLSLITMVIQKRQQQREAYRGIYEVLTSQELHRGRWLIIEVSRAGRLPDDRSPDFYLINRTAGWFDTLAMYVQRGVIPRRWVLDVWHHPLRDMQAGLTLMARDHLARRQDWTPWPHLWSLLDQSVRYRSSLPCCQPLDRAPAGVAHGVPQVPGRSASLDEGESRSDGANLSQSMPFDMPAPEGSAESRLQSRLGENQRGESPHTDS